MATTVQFTIPDELVNAASILTREQTLVAVATFLVAAVLTSIVVELIKRRYSAKEREKLAKKYVALLLAGVSSVFTLLASLLVFAQENASILSSLPFVGKHFMTIVGISYVIYSLKFNRIYIAASSFLSKWSKGNKQQQQESVPVTPIQANQQVVTDPAQFV